MSDIFKQPPSDTFPLGAQLQNPVTVKRLPAWAASGDVVTRRGKRWLLVSLHQSEPRWRRWLRRLKLLK